MYLSIHLLIYLFFIVLHVYVQSKLRFFVFCLDHLSQPQLFGAQVSGSLLHNSLKTMPQVLWLAWRLTRLALRP